jgi:hypothetical protein
LAAIFVVAPFAGLLLRINLKKKNEKKKAAVLVTVVSEVLTAAGATKSPAGVFGAVAAV